ncbi:hypothetical protein V8C86DRAFT_2810807 [Haematococcus lacustris]
MLPGVGLTSDRKRPRQVTHEAFVWKRLQGQGQDQSTAAEGQLKDNSRAAGNNVWLNATITRESLPRQAGGRAAQPAKHPYVGRSQMTSLHRLPCRGKPLTWARELNSAVTPSAVPSPAQDASGMKLNALAAEVQKHNFKTADCPAISQLSISVGEAAAAVKTQQTPLGVQPASSASCTSPKYIQAAMNRLVRVGAKTADTSAGVKRVKHSAPLPRLVASQPRALHVNMKRQRLRQPPGHLTWQRQGAAQSNAQYYVPSSRTLVGFIHPSL